MPRVRVIAASLIFCLAPAALAAASQTAQNPRNQQTQTSGSTSTVDISTLDQTCTAGQTSKTIKATVTVTNQEGRSASKSTTITVNCKPPFLRLPDLIFKKNASTLDECSKRILLDQAAGIANTGKYNVILVGFRSAAENSTTASGTPIDYARAVHAGAVLVECARVKPSAIRIATAGAAKTPVPTSVACADLAATEPMPEDWYSRVEVYLIPKNSSYLPANAQHPESLPTTLPQNETCDSTASAVH